jgi:hypothetical protein
VRSRLWFVAVLRLASESTPVILLIDGVDHLLEGGQSLTWLPPALPPNVSLLLSCSSGSDAHQAAARFGWLDEPPKSLKFGDDDEGVGGALNVPRLQAEEVQAVARQVLCSTRRNRIAARRATFPSHRTTAWQVLTTHHKTLEAHHGVMLANATQASNAPFPRPNPQL